MLVITNIMGNLDALEFSNEICWCAHGGIKDIHIDPHILFSRVKITNVILPNCILVVDK